MLRSIALAVVSLTVLVAAIAFAALNPGVISLDFGTTEVEVQKALALTVAFATGWLFGVLCLAVATMRMWLQRRKMRMALRLAEAEIHTLRSVPVGHAN